MKITVHTRVLLVAILSLLLSSMAADYTHAESPFVLSVAKLSASEPSAGDEFGYAVSIHGDTLVVGAPRHDVENNGVKTNNVGSAFVLTYSYDETKSVRHIVQQSKLTAGIPEAEDLFGNAVSFSGDTLVVGAYKADELDANGNSATNAGSVYVLKGTYDETTATWDFSQQAKLFATEPSPGDEFGQAVAISGDTLVVGAHRDDAVGSGSGAAYVFRYNGSTWVEEAKLTAGNLAAGDRFGYAVAIDGNTLVVGALYDGASSSPGAAYVFRHDGSTWLEEAKLAASGVADGDKFGQAVTIAGDTLVIGAPYHDAGASDSGAAFVFRYDGSEWFEEAKLIASDSGAKAGVRFGNTVSLSGKTIVVGAYRDDAVVDNNLVTTAGSAYVFRHDGTIWNEEAKLTAVDGAAADEFGYSVAISGDTVLVGARKDDDAGASSGSAYVFTLVPENQPPVAVAGEDQEVVEGQLVTLDGSESYDPDGDNLIYEWQQNPHASVTLNDPSNVKPTFYAPAVSAESESLTFQLIVSDGRAESVPAKVKVTVLKNTQNVIEINSYLGRKRSRWGLYRDVYTFQGTQGDKVTVTLRARSGGKNNGGDRATLKLKDNISGVRFCRIDSSVLPNKISATLPATGQYLITIAGQPRFFRGKRFKGKYSLAVTGISGRLEKGSRSSTVTKTSGSAAKSHKFHRIWNWLVKRFRR